MIKLRSIPYKYEIKKIEMFFCLRQTINPLKNDYKVIYFKVIYLKVNQ
jgi:hypothetical protein